MKKYFFGILFIVATFFVGTATFACQLPYTYYVNTGNNNVYVTHRGLYGFVDTTGGTLVTGADANSWTNMGFYLLAKDKNHVYLGGKIMSGVDTETYQKLIGPFRGDKNQVFIEFSAQHKLTNLSRNDFNSKNLIKKSFQIYPSNSKSKNIIKEVNKIFKLSDEYKQNTFYLYITSINKYKDGWILVYISYNGIAACFNEYNYIQIPKTFNNTLFIKKAQKIAAGSGAVSEGFVKQFLKYVQLNKQL